MLTFSAICYVLLFRRIKRCEPPTIIDGQLLMYAKPVRWMNRNPKVDES